MKLFLLPIFAFAACLSCSNKSASTTKPDDVDTRQVFTPAGLANSKFASECSVRASKKYSDKEVIHFVENTIETINQVFYSDKCDEAMKSVDYVNRLAKVQQEKMPDLEGWLTFRYEYKELLAIPRDKDTAEQFNFYKVYGYSDWAVNVPKDIAGRRYDVEDAAEFTVGTKRIATIKREEDTLKWASYKNNEVNAEDSYIYKLVP